MIGRTTLPTKREEMPYHLPELIGKSGLAYIDPGTGSLLIQATIAALVAVPFLLRNKLLALAYRIRHGRSKGDAEQSGKDRADS